MPDISIGSAWVDVGLKFDKLNADMKTVGPKLAPLQTSATKGLKEQNKLEDERIKKMHELLGITQDIADTEASRIKNMSFVDRTMSAMGAKINKGGMMGAQLSYAAQDFVTGLAMGNLNMAIMGASNNLGMMAMQISSTAAAWTTLGLVSIPLIITAFKAFGTEETRTKAAVDALTAAFERQKFAIGLNVIAREALSDAEVKRMHGAAALQGRLDDERHGIENINEALNDQKVIHNFEKKKELASGFERVGGRPANDEMMARFEKLRRRQAEQGVIHGPGFSPAQQGTIQGALGLPGNITDYQFNRMEGGGVEVFRKVRGEELEKAKEQFKEVQSDIARMEAERDKRQLNFDMLSKQRESEARDELQFAQREANARFNQYEHRKIQLEKQERDERRQIRETFGDIKVGPAMTAEERKKREEEIDKKAIEDTDSTSKRMQEYRDKKLIHGRHLTDAEIKGFDEEKAQIEENRKKSQRELQKQFEAGEPTLADPMLKANAAKFQRQRIELAEQFANQGPRGHFTGIEQLAKDVQMGMGGGKSLDIAQQQLDTQKGMEQALLDLRQAVNNLNLGVGP